MATADWGKLLEQLQGQTKTKLTALDQLQARVQAGPLPRDCISSLLDHTPQLLGDNNYKVALKLLTCWEAVCANSRDYVKPYTQGLLSPVIDRLGDNRQDVRQAACNLLLELLQVLRADVMMDRLSRFWSHRNWKVRHGLLQFVAEAVSISGEAALTPPRDESNWVLHKVIGLVGDPESAVRDAAIECLEEVYRVYGEGLVDILSAHQLRPAHLNAIYARLAQLGADVAQQQEQQEFADLQGGGAEDEAAAMMLLQRQRASATDGAACNEPGGLEAGKSWGSSVAAAPPAAAAPAPAARAAKRGGYKDGGGITSDGGLPPVHPLSVSSERELAAELERIIDALNKGAAVDWEKRVAALVRLEGLVKGGAPGQYEVCFMEHLRALKDPLLDQMVDRRSAVARQAAHIFGVLAAALGMRFEPYATTFLGHLFKGLVITVLVVSESSHHGACAILRHCRAPKLVPQVCDILTGDKSAKLRKHCSFYLVQILEEWDVHEYSHHLDALEAAIMATVQDALGETRTNGRTAFAAYAAVLPDRASALLRRLDAGLQQKLQEAVFEYGKGGHAVAAVVATVKQRPKRQAPAHKPWKVSAGSSNAGSEPEIVVVAPPMPPPGQQRPGGAAQAMRGTSSGGSSRVSLAPGAQRSSMAPPAAVPVAPAAADGGMAQHASLHHAALAGGAVLAAPSAATAVRNSRKSVAGVPMRVQSGGQGSVLGCHEAAGGIAEYSSVSAAAAAAAANSRKRRTSMMPQRVPYADAGAHHVPRPPAGLAPVGRVAQPPPADFAAGGGGPDSPESYAHSDTSGAGPLGDNGSGGAAVGLEYRGGAAAAPRLFHAGAGKASKAAATGAGDDLQTQLLLRDQLQQQQQQHAHYAVAQERAGSSLSMASSGQQQLAGGPSALAVAMMHAAAAATKPATLPKAVAAVLANSKDWKERVDTMSALADALSRQVEADARPEAFVEVEKVVPRLMAAMDDAHFKVSLAALSLLQVCINTCPHVLESSLDKLMPLLFLKLCGAKQSVRAAAEAALQGCALEVDVDVLLPALTRSLEVMKQPAARVSVMEFVVLFMGVGNAAGVPTNATHLRQWIAKNIPLLLDKNPNVRQMAGRALSTMFGIDVHSVSAVMQHSSPQEVQAVQRCLAEADAMMMAAHEAAAAEEEEEGEAATAWAQHAAEEQPPSVASSADFSQEQQHYAHSDMQQHAAAYSAGVPQQHAAAHAYVTQRDVQGLTASLAGGLVLDAPHHHHQQQPAAAAAVAVAPYQQQQPFQQHQQHYQQHDVLAAEASAAAAAAAASRRNSLNRDVLGRPLPEPAAAPDAASHHGTPQQPRPQQAAGPPPASPAYNSAAAQAAAAAVASGDASSQARHLTVLVHRLQSRPADDVLAELAACAAALCRQAWEDNFSKVLLAGLSAAQHSSESIRELAFLLVLTLTQHHGCLFEPVLDVVLQPLLQGCADASREVLVAAQQALNVLMQEMPPLACAAILSHKLPSEAAVSSGTAVDGEVLCATVRCLQTVARRMTAAQLMAVAPSQLLPGLFAAFQHPRPDVRKAVVFCLVEMWFTAGETLTPYLAGLSTSQLKLLTVYSNRMQHGGGQQQLSDNGSMHAI